MKLTKIIPALAFSVGLFAMPAIAQDYYDGGGHYHRWHHARYDEVRDYRGGGYYGDGRVMDYRVEQHNGYHCRSYVQNGDYQRRCAPDGTDAGWRW